MEGAVLSVSTNNNRFRTHLKNAACAICARTLPKQRRSEPAVASSTRHHTYPRATPPKRSAIPCRMDPIVYPPPQHATFLEPPKALHYEQMEVQLPNMQHGTVKLRGTLAREVANAWECRVGPPDQAASANRVQSLFNDIELYPTKTQVFEMLVCARQCARRKSLTLTFGEFCVFAAELRRCSRQARQTSNKPESPVWNIEKELRDKDTICKHVNGSEASPPPEVFLGGSCNPTTWRSDIAIPMLKKMGITYFNPQVEDWSMELVEVEHRAKAAARALLFVLDSETRAVAACVEAAHLAAAPKDLLLVLRPYTRHQAIGHETISDHEYVELSRARATLQEAVERRGLPAFTDIPAALRCARAVLRGARTHPRHSLGHTILRLKRAYDAAGGRAALLPRARAVDVLRDVTRVPRDLADRCVPLTKDVDFETFCAAVAELAADAGSAAGAQEVHAASAGGCEGVTSRVLRAFRSLRLLFAPPAPENQPRNGQEASKPSEAGARGEGGERAPDASRDRGVVRYNARLRAYGRKLGLFIPKNGGNRVPDNVSGETESSVFTPSTERVFTPGTERGFTPGTERGFTPGTERVFTPGTERRLERLPAMLGAPTHDVYLAGSFPSNSTRPEEILKREGLTYVIPRANDYTRMFSTAARRAAPAHPESPCRDKKPRPEPLAASELEDIKLRERRDKIPHPESLATTEAEDVQLREKTPNAERADRLSASDFYTVTEDVTPQPFKGTYDEDLLLGSRVLVFSLSSEAPCFAAMVLAAHYMGLRPAATVLLVQPMDPLKATNYSEAAIKDYNRGRHYLSDLARRSGVPVFEDVTSTVEYVVNRLRTTL